MVLACIICARHYGLAVIAVHFGSNLFLSCDYVVFPQTLGLNLNQWSQISDLFLRNRSDLQTRQSDQEI